MVAQEVLVELLHQADLSKAAKLLLCLATDDCKPKSTQEIKAIASQTGLRAARTWDVAKLFQRAGGHAVKTAAGWELRASGREYLAQLVGKTGAIPSAKVVSSLRSQLPKLKNAQTLAFVEEAIRCYENKLYRAAVVLSWVGAVAVLYETVVKAHLSAFNTEAIRRNTKWKAAVTVDDLARMKEKDFLDILDHLSLIGKNVKQELDNCLTFRNGCGHPNSLSIAENRVAGHIEMLVLNVFVPFAS